MKNLLIKLFKDFFPNWGAQYGAVLNGKLERGAYRLDRDGKQAQIYYYSYLSTGHISKRSYKQDFHKRLDLFKTEDLSPTGERYQITLSAPKTDAIYRSKFELIERQYVKKTTR